MSVKEGDCEGRHVVIVDDLVKSGGTLIRCGEALKARGAKSLSIFVTHAVFPQDTWRKFLRPDDPRAVGTPLGWEYIWTTDSVPSVSAAVGDSKPFELLSLAPLIADLL